MFGVPSPRADERAVLAFEDLASALDAGLDPTALGAPPAAADDWIVHALASRRVALHGAEPRMLVAASRAGRLPEALRQRAAARSLRAAMVRKALAGLRYPLVLLAVALLVAFVVGRAQRSAVPWLVVGGAIAVLILGLTLLVRNLRRPGALAARLPGLRAMVQDLGELPYLQALHGLYAAGVPLRDAHAEATAACPVAEVRARLQAADPILQEGVPLAEALARAGALQPETQTLLATGERAGDLEDALARAARRRAEVLARRAEQGVRGLSVAVYVLAMGVAVFLIFRFYAGLLGGLGTPR